MRKPKEFRGKIVACTLAMMAAGIETMRQAATLIHLGRCGPDGNTRPRMVTALRLPYDAIRADVEKLEALGLVKAYTRSATTGRAEVFAVTPTGWQLLTTAGDFRATSMRLKTTRQKTEEKMKKLPAFSFPLSTDALAAFSREGESPFRYGDEVVASIGYACIRVTRGRFLVSDYAEDAARLDRVMSHPWELFTALGGSPDWRKLELEFPKLYKKGTFPNVFGNFGGLADCPIVRIAHGQKVRLTLLQLAGRLPACEIYTGPRPDATGVLFRFSGGCGMLAASIGRASQIDIFKPRYDVLDGTRLAPFEKQPPKPTWPLNNWPPPECAE